MIRLASMGRVMVTALSLAGLLAAGCDKKLDSPVAALDPTAASTAATRAAQSPELQGKLEFEPVAVAELGATFVLPKGWKKISQDGQRAQFRSPTNDLGEDSTVYVSSYCEEPCTPKDDWAAAVNKMFVSRIGTMTVLDDVTGDTMRTAVMKIGSRVYVLSALWRKGGDRMYLYDVQLGPPATQAFSAFREAARGTRVDAWPRP